MIEDRHFPFSILYPRPVITSYRIRVLVRAHVHGLLNLGAENFFAVLAVSDHGVLVQGDLSPAESSLVNFCSFLNFVTVDYPVRTAKKLQHREQFPIGIAVALDRLVHAWTEHLLQIIPRHPTRRNVVAVGFSAELWIERQRYFGHVHHVIERVVAVFGPGAVLVHLDQALHANLTDTGRHATCLHRLPAALGIFALDAWIAGDALF